MNLLNHFMGRPFFLFSFLLVAAIARVGAAVPATSSADIDSVVKPFFAEHCNSCHGEKKQKGDLRVDTL